MNIGLAIFRRFMLQDVPKGPPWTVFSHKCENNVLKKLEFLKEEGVHFPSPIYPCPQVCRGSMTIQNTTHQRSFILMLMYIIIVYFLSEYNTSCNLREVRNMLQWTWHIQEAMMCIIQYDICCYKLNIICCSPLQTFLFHPQFWANLAGLPLGEVGGAWFDWGKGNSPGSSKT